MSCECFQIGGPFIGVDPDCEIHCKGGYEDRITELEAEQAEADAQNQRMMDQVSNGATRIAELEAEHRDCLQTITDMQSKWDELQVENERLREENAMLLKNAAKDALLRIEIATTQQAKDAMEGE